MCCQVHGQGANNCTCKKLPGCTQKDPIKHMHRLSCAHKMYAQQRRSWLAAQEQCGSSSDSSTHFSTHKRCAAVNSVCSPYQLEIGKGLQPKHAPNSERGRDKKGMSGPLEDYARCGRKERAHLTTAAATRAAYSCACAICQLLFDTKKGTLSAHLPCLYAEHSTHSKRDGHTCQRQA